MNRFTRLAIISVLCLAACTPAQQTPPAESVTIDYPTLLDKVEGGWVGQMAGVQWGAPTEFRYQSKIIPDEVPWSPDSINGAYNNDDLYVEIPFMETMSEYGVNAGWAEFGESFLTRSSSYGMLIGRDARCWNLASPLLNPVTTA